ncbi:MAG: hypothetical protein ABI664_14565 [bacterium]
MWPVLGKALALPFDIRAFRFEYKPERFPVGPRTPNMDLLFELTDGHSVGVESKFAEPYRSAGSKIALSPKSRDPALPLV